MKKFLITLTVTIFLTSSCHESSDVKPIDLNEIESNYINTLKDDKHFNNFLEILETFGSKKLLVSTSEFNSLINSIESNEDLIKIVEESFESPNEVMASIKSYTEAVEIFKNHHREFYMLPLDRQSYILNQSYNQVKGYPSELDLRTESCKSEYEAERAGCRRTAYAEAAVCGLLSPTIGGAALCGATVYGLLAVCYYNAEENYKACIQ